MAKNDFMEGFLKGLYQSGVGNPEVQRQSTIDTQTRQAQLDAQMKEKGMMRNTFPQDHPMTQKIGGFISQMFGGPSEPLQTAYKEDPNFAKYYQTPSGETSFVKGAGTPLPPGAVSVPAEKGPALAASTGKLEMSNVPFDMARSYAVLMGKPGSLEDLIKSAQSQGKSSLSKDEMNNAIRSVSAGAMSERSKVWEERLKYQKVKDLVQMTGIKPGVIQTLQTNNMRADRALERLGQDKMTWQDFNTVITDWQGIMQGGVPHEQQYADSRFPNWKERMAGWQTYASAHPTETVTPELQDYMKGVVQGLKEVDNNYLQQNADYIGSTLGTTIPGYSEPGGLGEKVQTGTTKLIKGGVGSIPSKLSSEDQQALDWANQNPNDPRAQKIKALHGL